MPTDKDPRTPAELLHSRQASISDGLFETGVAREDAEAVFNAAQSIEDLRDEGSLPGLEPNLLAIHNPNTAIMARPQEGQGA